MWVFFFNIYLMLCVGEKSIHSCIIFWCSPERNLQSDFKPSACLEQIMGCKVVCFSLSRRIPMVLPPLQAISPQFQHK